MSTLNSANYFFHTRTNNRHLRNIIQVRIEFETSTFYANNQYGITDKTTVNTIFVDIHSIHFFPEKTTDLRVWKKYISTRQQKKTAIAFQVSRIKYKLFMHFGISLPNKGKWVRQNNWRNRISIITKLFSHGLSSTRCTYFEFALLFLSCSTDRQTRLFSNINYSFQHKQQYSNQTQ